jgi:hypothetical protein
VIAENCLDGSIDVQVEHWAAVRSHGGKPIFGRQRLEIDNGLLVEAAEAAVDRVDTGNDAAGQVLEDRVGRERLDAEHAAFSGCGGDEQLDLRLHWVDDQSAGLQSEDNSRRAAVTPMSRREPPNRARPP